jgi:UDP-N-acetylmuramoylalanine--D-glutamate ligase
VWLGHTRARWGSKTASPLFELAEIPLLGNFNRLNAAAAAAAALSMNVPPDDVREGLRSFRPVEHRLETVAKVQGVRYVNDSVSTTPESTNAALDALGPHVVLICGGASKGCSFRGLGEAIARRTRGVVLVGQTAEGIREAIPAHGGARIFLAADLETAVSQARRIAKEGDTILLSPACPSYDQFSNFVERGERFKEIVVALSRVEVGS